MAKQFITQSPQPEKKELEFPIVSPSTTPNPNDFPSAMRNVILGKHVTKREWNNPLVVVGLVQGHLRIKLEDGLWHDLIVSDGDMFGTDWYISEPPAVR